MTLANETSTTVIYIAVPTVALHIILLLKFTGLAKKVDLFI